MGHLAPWGHGPVLGRWEDRRCHEASREVTFLEPVVLRPLGCVSVLPPVPLGPGLQGHRLRRTFLRRICGNSHQVCARAPPCPQVFQARGSVLPSPPRGTVGQGAAPCGRPRAAPRRHGPKETSAAGRAVLSPGASCDDLTCSLPAPAVLSLPECWREDFSTLEDILFHSLLSVCETFALLSLP